MARLPQFELQVGEQIHHEETAMFLKSKIKALGGKLVLTDRRLAFIKNKVSVFGGAGGLLGALLFKPKPAGVLFDIELDRIRTYARSKHGVNKNVLAVATPEHEELRFILDSKYEEWVELLQQAAPNALTEPASVVLA